MKQIFLVKIIFFLFIITNSILLFSMNKKRADHCITIFNNEKAPYIKWIATGKKKVEGRVNSPFFKKLKVNDRVIFYSKKQDYVLCEIIFLHTYENFYEMLLEEGVENMLPETKSINVAGNVYLSFPGSNRVKKYGALAIGVVPLEAQY